MITRKTMVLLLLPLWFGSVGGILPTRMRTASNPGAAVQTRPLDAILKADGTLDLKSAGPAAFNAVGWKMVVSADGTPRFFKAAVNGLAPKAPAAPQIAGNEFWDRQFLTGLGDPSGSPYVFAITLNGSDVYVGGSFSQAGDIPVSNIARWDSLNHHWSALGPGLNNRVQALVIQGNCLVAGGFFNYAGSTPADDLACWNLTTHSWSAVASGITQEVTSPIVYALAVDGSGRLVVGGQFSSIGVYRRAISPV